MKNVAILSNYYDTPQFSDIEQESFYALTCVAREQGVELVRVSMHSFDEEKGIFLNYVDFDADEKLQIFHKPYRPDVIWNRSPSEGQLAFGEKMKKKGIPVFPSSRLMAIGSDKYEMYMLFRAYQPYSLLLKDFFSSLELREKCTDTVVLKPIRSHSGKGIVFLTQSELLAQREKYEGLEFLYIVQNFTDFSAGIPGLVDGIHDIRLIFLERNFIDGLLRIPKEGSLKSNLGAGGTAKVLKKESIPGDLWKIIPDILDTLNPSKTDLYSIDFGYVASENRWYIFEINDSPGLGISTEVKGEYVHDYFHSVSQFMRDNFN